MKIEETAKKIEDWVLRTKGQPQKEEHDELITLLHQLEAEVDELWEKRVMFVLFQEGSLTKDEARKVVNNLSKGKIDNLISKPMKGN